MAENAARRATSRWGGTPGPAIIERPISAVAAIARSGALPSSEIANSGNAGTFGSSAWRFSAAW